MKKSQKDISNIELAGLINGGFTNVQEQLDELKFGQNNLQGGQKRLEVRLGNLENKVGQLEFGQKETNYRLTRIEDRLPYFSPQFEVDELKKRVGIVEKKIGIKRIK